MSRGSRRPPPPFDGVPHRPRAVPRHFAPSPELAAVVGDEPLTRGEMTRRVWAYIRAQGLQDAGDRRVIRPDAALRAVFDRDSVHMLSMMGLLAPHMKLLRG